MVDDPDPITAIGLNHGCFVCGTRADAFYAVEYYMLPRKLTRKRHRDKERFTLYCQSCYEQNQSLMISVDDEPLAISKVGCRNMNSLECAVCHAAIKDGQLYGVVTSLHMIDGSGIESMPLAWLCADCAEHRHIEL